MGDAEGISGFLFKLGIKGSGGWKKRWFLLDPQELLLHYYKDEKRTQKPTGSLDLSRATVHLFETDQRGRQNVFAVTPASMVRSYMLSADNPLLAMRWVDALQQVVDAQPVAQARPRWSVSLSMSRMSPSHNVHADEGELIEDYFAQATEEYDPTQGEYLYKYGVKHDVWRLRYFAIIMGADGKSAELAYGTDRGAVELQTFSVRLAVAELQVRTIAFGNFRRVHCAFLWAFRAGDKGREYVVETFSRTRRENWLTHLVRLGAKRTNGMAVPPIIVRSSLKEGYLEKQGGTKASKTGWKVRYFMLLKDPPCLHYFKSREHCQKRKGMGTVPLTLGTKVMPVQPGPQLIHNRLPEALLSILAAGGERRYLFAAPDNREAGEWVRAIRAAVPPAAS